MGPETTTTSSQHTHHNHVSADIQRQNNEITPVDDVQTREFTTRQMEILKNKSKKKYGDVLLHVRSSNSKQAGMGNFFIYL